MGVSKGEEKYGFAHKMHTGCVYKIRKIVFTVSRAVSAAVSSVYNDKCVFKLRVMCIFMQDAQQQQLH